MMKIEIKGAGWRKKVMLHTAMLYFAKKLSGFRQKRIKLKVELVPGLVEKQKYRGEASQISRLSFRIKLDAGLKPMSLIKCLAHEMIHVQQWLTGQMEDLVWTRYRVRWGKRVYYPANLAYGKHPWEIQAHRMEDDLWNSWVKFWN